MVTRRWHGVNKGDTVEFEEGKVPAALKSNVIPLPTTGKDHSESESETVGGLKPLPAATGTTKR